MENNDMFRVLFGLILYASFYPAFADISKLSFVVGRGPDDSPQPMLIQTMNRGASWSSPQIPNMPSNGALTSGACNNHMCIAAGADANNTPLIMQTTDHGKNWEKVELNADMVWLSAYAACGKSMCVVVGSNNPGATLVQTKDGGASWSQVSLRGMVQNGTLQAIDCLDDFCVAVGDDGIYQLIIQTNDGGLTWARNDRVGRHPGVLIDVDCNASFCVAAGNKTSWGLTPMLVQTDHARLFWYDKTVDTLDTSGSFTAIKCTKNTCLAAGFSQTEQDLFVANLSKDGSTWLPMPFTEGFDKKGFITDISCQKTHCFIAGMTVDHESLLLDNRHDVWAPVTLPTAAIPGRLAMVSCSDTLCFAAGKLNSEEPLLMQSVHGRPWQSINVPGMPENGLLVGGGCY
jgi:photosystem II stability/assembly factor-like uncharacterized protein